MSTSARKRRVLISAYACNPSESSEPAVGWQFLRSALDASFEVVLVTRPNNVASIEENLSSEDREALVIVPHDLGTIAKRLKPLSPAGTQIYYFLWQLTLGRRVADLHRHREFDVAHHVTFAVDWMPVAINALPKSVRNVWGPISGNTNVRISTIKYLGIRGCLAEGLRIIATTLGRFAFARASARRADLVIFQNDDADKRLVRCSSFHTIETNSFIDARVFRETPDGGIRDPHLLIGVGRLIPWKGWALAIEALLYLPGDSQLVIYGTGPDRRRLLKLAQKLGVASRLKLVGSRPRAEIVNALRRAHCLVHPSFHDSGAIAVAEAITIGCPVVCLDAGGPATLLRRSGGEPLSTRAPQLAQRLAKAIEEADKVPNRLRWLDSRLPLLLQEWYSDHGLPDRPKNAT